MASAPGLRAELGRRKSLTTQLEDYLKARPGQWIPMIDLATIGGIGGWRTRLSELGRRKQSPLQIEHNGKNGEASCHRYVPPASEPSPHLWPVVGAPAYEEPWGLKP